MTQTKNHILTEPTHILMEKVIEPGNLRKALKRVETNKGAPGVDNMRVEELRPYLTVHWPRIKQELLEGTYTPHPVRRVEIPKSDGGMRQLGIPTVTDRFIQQAIQQVLTPIFEPIFSEFSYGFRPGKSARQAVRKAQSHIQDGHRIVVDIDLEKFFDRVNHDVLMMKIVKQVEDRRIHKIIRKYLQSGVMMNGCVTIMEEGTPQGGPISPLLSNIMLNDLDHELMKRGHKFVRYADDCNIYVASKRAGRRVYESIKGFIQTRLKLKVNEAKSAVDHVTKRKFLGFSFFINNLQVKLRVAPKTKIKFMDTVRRLTRRSWGISMEIRIHKINEYLLGWSGYFGIAQTKSLFEGLDQWIRRRLRMCHIKQWKKCKTKLANLMKLGLTQEWAGCIAYSRKKYWRLANTPQINKALGLSYWKEQGLVSLVDRYEGMLTPTLT